MPKYRKKPIVIEAIQLEYGINAVKVGTWLLMQGFEDFQILDNTGRMAIKTLEGTMTAEVGDYIIRGIHGEFYPCKPDIFEATYEEVTE